MDRNQKALRILKKMYWSAEGWRENLFITPEDFRYACDAGYLFSEAKIAPQSHDETVDRIITLKQRISVEAASRAFLCSLSSRHLELRSVLGSFAVARHLFPHPLRRVKEDTIVKKCALCGAYELDKTDFNLFNFVRFQFGGVDHFSPEYIAFDLKQFAALDACEPTPQDIAIFENILNVVSQLTPQAKARDLEKQLKDVLPSNQAERKILIQILNYCGILQPQGYASFFADFVTWEERANANIRTEWDYSMDFWRAGDGINQAALDFYFPTSVLKT